MFMVITVILSHWKGVKYCCVWSQFSQDVFQTCCSKSCLGLLSMNLPSLLKFMGYNYLNNLFNQAIHTTFYLSQSVNVVDLHAVQYPQYILLQTNSLAGPGKCASWAPCSWFINACLSDIHLPTSTWYTTYSASGVCRPIFPWVVFFTGRWRIIMSHLVSLQLILFEAACW